jgi:predicted HD superfamily hydrolase involved in NAD metabolism
VREYTPELESEIAAWSQGRQEEERFTHTQRVVETVTRLAEKWSPSDVMMLRLAGWIHDAAKSMPDDKLLAYAEKKGVEITPAEREVPMLLHGVVAYLKADKKFDLQDERIRTACTYHTTGHPSMSLTDKLLFLADKIEPESDFPGVHILREMVMMDVDQTLLVFLDGMIRYLLDRRRVIDPRVLDFYNGLVKNQKGK